MAATQAAGDALVALGGLLAACFLRFVLLKEFLPNADEPTDLARYLPWCLVGAALYLVVAANLGLYESRHVFGTRRVSESVLRPMVIWFFVFLGVTLFLKPEPSISRAFFVFGFGTTLLGQLLWRRVLATVSRLLLLRGVFQQRLIVVGTGTAAADAAGRIQQRHDAQYGFVGFVAAGTEGVRRRRDKQALGRLDELEGICERHQPDHILVADGALAPEQVLEVARTCERRFIGFSVAASKFEVFTSCLQLRQLAGLPVMSVADLPANRLLNRYAKRLVDVVGGCVGLLVSVPLIAVLAVLIRRESPGPVFYRQVRVGQGGHPFAIIKLRSMRLDAEKDGPRWCVPGDSRRTRIGEFMRRYNLDELPQFWNVLCGEMSLVGPRPERPELIPEFLERIPYYQSRHSVKPGMTGWAQVNGLRGNTSLRERIRHDLEYIENWSLWWDFTIQFQTLYKIRNAY